MPIARANGSTISYEVVGAGPPVLLIMGFASDSRMWMAQVPALATRYTVITFDNRGVRASTADDEAFTMDDLAADAIAVLDHAGIEQAHVVGISMGGAIAQHVALRAPERLRSLTLAATWCAPNAYTRRLSEMGRAMMAGGGHEAVLKTSILLVFTPGFIIHNDAFLSQFEDMAGEFTVPLDVFERQLNALLAHDTQARLAELTVPTLVLCPRSDVFVPTVLCEALAAAIPGSKLVHIDGGHAFNIESSAAFNQELLAFLDRA